MGRVTGKTPYITEYCDFDLYYLILVPSRATYQL